MPLSPPPKSQEWAEGLRAAWNRFWDSWPTQAWASLKGTRQPLSLWLVPPPPLSSTRTTDSEPADGFCLHALKGPGL